MRQNMIIKEANFTFNENFNTRVMNENIINLKITKKFNNNLLKNTHQQRLAQTYENTHKDGVIQPIPT